MEVLPPAPLILVVDDDAGLARLIEKFLRRHGYRTATASSGRDALDWLDKQRADLVVLDLQLADMSGRDIIGHLAERQRSVPFVIITGQGDERVAVEMMKLGALDYLVKDKEFLEFVPVMVERAMRQIERDQKLTVAEEAWRQESALTAAILDTSGALILVLDSQNRIVRFNHACERTTGYSTDEVKGKLVWDLFRTPAEGRELRAIFARLHAGEFPIRYENHWLTRQGERRRIAWSSTILPDKSGALAHIISSGIDITERHRAEIRLSLQYAVTRALADCGTLEEAAPRILEAVCEKVGWRFGELWRVDANAGVLRHVETWSAPPLASPEFEMVTRQTSLSPGVGLPGQVWSTGQPAWIADLLRERNFSRARAAADLGLRSGFGFPVLLGNEVLGVMVFFSLESRPLEPDLLPMFANIGTQIGQFIDRKRLGRELLQISELEQHRIGQDLHDGICQELAGIEIMSQVLVEKLAAKSRTHAANAAEIGRLVREAITHTRDLARGLSPVVLESQGLMSALEELASGTEKIFRVQCQFRCPTPVPVHDNTVATHLYRIAQEAVSNAIKHGKASAIEIGLTRAPEYIRLSIKDDGIGVPDELPRGNGMGLRIMHYRAGMIGGSLVVQKDAGGGTSVVCTTVMAAEKPARPPNS